MIVLNCIKNDCDCIKQLTIKKHELNAVLQLCYGENKLHFNEMMMEPALY
jgi:hypothetical protein